SHLGVGLLGGAIADAADQRAGAVDGEGDAFFAGLQALDPIDRHLLAIGMRDGPRHAGDLVVAGEPADARRIGERRRAQQESFGANGHEGRIRGAAPGGEMPVTKSWMAETNPAMTRSRLKLANEVSWASPKRRRGPWPWSRIPRRPRGARTACGRCQCRRRRRDAIWCRAGAR